MTDKEYINWLLGLSSENFSREEMNLSFVLSISIIESEAYKAALRKLNLLKQVSNGTHKQTTSSSNF